MSDDMFVLVNAESFSLLVFAVSALLIVWFFSVQSILFIPGLFRLFDSSQFCVAFALGLYVSLTHMGWYGPVYIMLWFLNLISRLLFVSFPHRFISILDLFTNMRICFDPLLLHVHTAVPLPCRWVPFLTIVTGRYLRLPLR